MENTTNEKTEEFKVSGAGILKNEKGESVIEIPLTLGAVGAVLVPILAAVGALAALLSDCTIVVVKK